MKVRMLQERKYAWDGIRNDTFLVGSVQDLPEEHAKGFIKNGWAEEDKSGPEPQEFKDENAAANEKAHKGKKGRSR